MVMYSGLLFIGINCIISHVVYVVGSVSVLLCPSVGCIMLIDIQEYQRVVFSVQDYPVTSVWSN